mmetsp:Transcript_62187/g.202913  ORF Transcript_62187/g.202913 Transcript_62187/m.202913 type:complete len:82 (+) Transcript_62187:1171-1416(+)
MDSTGHRRGSFCTTSLLAMSAASEKAVQRQMPRPMLVLYCLLLFMHWKTDVATFICVFMYRHALGCTVVCRHNFDLKQCAS